jgi:hypothetical protein
MFDAEFDTGAASIDDTLRVRITGLDGGVQAVEVQWAPRIGAGGTLVLPAERDWAAVEQTAEGTWCVVLWAPRGDE